MANQQEQVRTAGVHPDNHAVPDPPATVYLQPIAFPSILGLFGFAGATFMVAANLAHWFGNVGTPVFLFPFALTFGGIAQFLAGMWAYKARDGLGTAAHGTWGSFWIGYGILYWLSATGAINLPASGMSAALGYWFIVLAVVTWLCTVAAMAEDIGLTGVLAFLAAGSTAAAVGMLIASDKWVVLGGWLFIASAAIAFYTAGAMMINGSYGRTVMPVWKTPHAKSKLEANAGLGEPGVQHGQ